MFQNLPTIFNEHIPFSTTSMVSSNSLFVHFTFVVVATLLTHGLLWFGFDVG
jgi:hypothetical protein